MALSVAWLHAHQRLELAAVRGRLLLRLRFEPVVLFFLALVHLQVCLFAAALGFFRRFVELPLCFLQRRNVFRDALNALREVLLRVWVCGSVFTNKLG